MLNLKIVLEPSEDGGCAAYVPSLPGRISERQTENEALTNIKEAITFYLEFTDDDHVNWDKG